MAQVIARTRFLLGERRTNVRRLALRRKSNKLHASANEGSTSKLPVIVLPGFLSGSDSYGDLVDNLRDFGHVTEIVPMEASEWYPTLVGNSFEFYVHKLSMHIDSMYSEYGPLALVGHSAGGWIARICLGNKPYNGCECNKQDKVKALVTLGTPHSSLEDYPFGRIKESVQSPDGGALPRKVEASSLQFANYFYPDAGAFEPVKVVCVVGKLIQGHQLPIWRRLQYWIEEGGVPKSVARQDFAHTSYLSSAGDGGVDGDGVCPVHCGLWQGAEHIVLNDVFHSPGSEIPWYGSKDVMPTWEEYLTDQSAG